MRNVEQEIGIHKINPRTLKPLLLQDILRSLSQQINQYNVLVLILFLH